ncbi:uncharacterized protein [Argopecten irradians]|uniref:uncharacterized protein n=1 Tax=Argopecten irradians TaxID=31199 RepID=UPI00371D2F43
MNLKIHSTFLIITAGFTVSLGNIKLPCTEDMFHSSTNAYWACASQFALQSNWFPSPIAGLFSYQIWNGFDGFWQNGAVLEPFVNFMAYANHTRYKSVVKNSQRSLYSLLEAYGPYPSFDDMGWYGLSYVRIYEVLGGDDFLDSAEDIFNWAWTTGWDQSDKCNGGFFFDNLKGSKQTITNVEMFQLGVKLYRFRNDSGILDKVQQIQKFLFSNEIVDMKTHLVVDGIFIENCTSNGVYGPSYNGGVFIGALVEYYKVTRDIYYIELAKNIAEAIIETKSNNSRILTEYCDPDCNDDAIMFKGIFARNLRYLMDALPANDSTTRTNYQKVLDINVMAVLELNSCDKNPISKCNITFKDGPPFYNVSGPVFSPNWNGPFTVGAPMQQTSAFDLFVSSIYPGTTCSGHLCAYDPSYPPPQPLTCGSHPCPKHEECCEYSPYTSYTCCARGQKCNKQGICV